MEINTEASLSAAEPTNKVDPATVKGSSTAPSALHSGPSWIAAIAMTLLISAAVSIVTSYIYDIKYAQKIVSVDIKGYVAKQGEDYMTGKITETEFRQKFDHLENVVKAIPANNAVLMGDLVVRNVQVIKP